MSTSVEIAFGLYAPIKADGTFSTSDNISFSDVDDLKDNLSNRNPIVTMEPNYWLLDGNYKFVDVSDTRVGFMSDTQSDANTDGTGDFASPPELTIDFSEDHDLDGITLRFSGYTNDYPVDFDIDFYDSGAGLILSVNVSSNDNARYSYEAVSTIENVRQIVLTFNSTNKANRWLRLTSIDFGSNFFTGSDVKNAKLIERIDPLSLTLPENVLEFSIHSDSAIFSPVNPSGLWSTLQEGTPVEVYQIVNGSYIYMGLFYLDDWVNVTDYETDFEAGNAIGILETIPFGGMLMSTYIGSPGEREPSDVLDDLFGLTNLEYEADISLLGAYDNLVGYIPTGNVRDALRQICFALGGYVDCSRSGKVILKSFELASDIVTPDYTLSFAEQGANKPLKMAPLVTGVEVVSHQLTPSGATGDFQVESVIKDTYANGSYTVLVDFPAFGLGDGGSTTATVSFVYEFNAPLLFNSGNLTFTVTSPGVVDETTVRGTSVKTIYSEYAIGLSPGTKENIVKVSNNFLVNTDALSNNAADVVARLFDYYSQRYQPQLRLFSPMIRVGDSVAIEMPFSQTINAIVEKMTIDLSGGFIADVEVRGVLA